MDIENEVIARMVLWYTESHDTEETMLMVKRACNDDVYKRTLITEFLESRG